MNFTCSCCGLVIDCTGASPGQVLKCPKCQTAFCTPAIPVVVAHPAYAHQPHHDTNLKALAAVFVGLLCIATPVLLCGFSCAGCFTVVDGIAKSGDGKPRRDTYGEVGDYATESDGKRIGEDYLASLLKYPDDAEFLWGATITQNENGYWVVRGKVKAANGFGAKLTRPYTVSMSLTKETRKWKLRGAMLGDEVLYIDR